MKGGPGQEQRGVTEWVLGSQASPELRSQTAQSLEAGSAGRLSQPMVEARCVALGQQLCASVSSSIRRGPRQYLLPGVPASSHREPSTMAWPQGWRAQESGRHTSVTVTAAPVLPAPLLSTRPGICTPDPGGRGQLGPCVTDEEDKAQSGHPLAQVTHSLGRTVDSRHQAGLT